MSILFTLFAHVFWKFLFPIFPEEGWVIADCMMPSNPYQIWGQG
jgi:hypothetical protein